MTMAGSLITLALAPVQQDYLLEARQMQALSFAVHIPLVCFGDRLPGDGPLRRVALYAHRRRALPDAGETLDQGDGRPLRGRA